MNEDLDEEKDDFFENNEEFKEDFDREFESMDETDEIEKEFEIFEPNDELYDVDKSSINQFEPRKFDQYSPSRHKIEPRKTDPKSPPKHKIEPRKINPSKEPNHKLQPRKINPIGPSKHKIEPRKINQKKESIHKIQSQRVSHEKAKNKIGQIPSKEHSSIIKPNIASPSKKNSLINEKQKECRRCNQVKNINEFEKYQNSIERYCKPCRLEHKQVRALTNKTNIIRNMYGGIFGEKCPECNTTIAKLPAFDFHHPIKELKSKPINFHGNWENVLKRLEKEKVILSCRNCHLKKQPKYYNKYRKLIERKNEFESSLEGIESKLYKTIYKQYPDLGPKQGHQIKSWMSKTIVVERLYNGGCIGCREINIGTLQFHHREIEKKTFKKYDKLRYSPIVKIEKKLIQDDAVCLCGNCHRMVTSKHYEKNHQEIVGNNYSQQVKKIYIDLKETIKTYEFPETILNQYPNIESEKVDIGWKPKSYNLNSEEKYIKNEIMEYDWKSVTENWTLPSGELLNPTKECSRTNPLYKHKEWLKTVYINKNWGLSDTKIARLTNSSNSNINYWRNKLQIPAKKKNKGKNA